MKYLAITLVLIPILSSSVLAQKEDVLSIKNDTIKVNYLNDLAYKGYRKDVEQSEIYLRQSIQLADSLSFEAGRAKALRIKGICFSFKSKFDSALHCYNLAIKINRANNNESQIALCYNNIGNVYRKQSNYVQATIFIKKALEINTSKNNKAKICMNLNNIGLIYMKQSLYTEALDYYFKSLKISEELGDKKKESIALNNIGLINWKENNFDEAIKYYNLSLNISKNIPDEKSISSALNNLGLIYYNINKYDTAITYFENSLKIKKRLLDKRGTSMCLNNIGLCLYRTNKYENSLEHFSQSLAIKNDIGDKQGQAVTYLYFGKIYNRINNIGKASLYLDKSLEISTQLNLVEEQRDINKELANLYSKGNNYKLAYKHQLIFKQLSDSILNKSNIIEITNLENQYSHSKQLDSIFFKQEISDTKHVQNTNEAKFSKNIFLTAFLLTSLIIIIVFVVLVKYKKINRLLKSQKLKIETQNKTQESQITEINELSTFKDNITHMLVHDLKTPLNSIINQTSTLSAIEKNELVNFSSNEMLTLISNILDVKKYQETKVNLIKTKFDILPIWSTVKKNFNYSVNKKNIKIINSVDKKIMLFADEELITRVLTNLLSNAFKYSNNNGEIELMYETVNLNTVKFTIKDNGLGISSEDLPRLFGKYEQATRSKVKYSTGLGLTFCKFAIELHKGEIGIDSELNKGTAVWFTLPNVEIAEQEEIKEMENNEISLTTLEKNQLSKYKEQLNQTNIHQISALRKIISEIKNNTTVSKKWISNLNSSILYCNQEEYNKIINLIDNEGI